MMLNFDTSRIRFSDLSPQVMRAHLGQRANTLSALQRREDGEVVLTGRNTSPLSWLDPNMQTVMSPHDQGHLALTGTADLTPERIREFRSESSYDKAWHEAPSASYLICEPVADMAEGMLPDFWPTGTVRKDQLGFSVELPGYKVADFRDAAGFLVPLFQALDTRLAYAHGLVYESDQPDLEQFVHEQMGGSAFDVAGYEQFFKVKKDYPKENVLAQTLHSHVETEELRRGFGHIFGAGFWRSNGAQFEFSTGVLKGASPQDGLGPNEMRGTRMQRRTDSSVPIEQVKRNAAFISTTV